GGAPLGGRRRNLAVGARARSRRGPGEPRRGPDPGHLVARLVGPVGDGDPALRIPLPVRNDPPPERAGRPRAAAAVGRRARRGGARPPRGPAAPGPRPA